MKQSFQDQMESVEHQTVKDMLRRIDKALDERFLFEDKKKKPAIVELVAARQQMEGNETLARFFVVMNADPVQYLNRERKRGFRTNLKTVRKVRMLSEYMAGQHGAINGVCKALFAATIIAGKHRQPWTSNNDAEKLLFGLPHMTFMESEELFRSYESFSRLNIQAPEEARNQACQFRTAFENLGVYFKSREDDFDMSSSGIYADMNNPLIKALAKRWGL